MRKIIVLIITGTLLGSCKKSKIMDNQFEVAKQYYQILDNGSVNEIETLLAPNLIDHDGHGTNAVEEIKELTRALHNGFENSHHDIEQLYLIDDNKVFIRWRMKAKHIGSFFGAPASGNQVDFVGHDLLKINGNKITEIWHVENLLGMMEQLKTLKE